jgi:hypothetical protein
VVPLCTSMIITVAPAITARLRSATVHQMRPAFPCESTGMPTKTIPMLALRTQTTLRASNKRNVFLTPGNSVSIPPPQDSIPASLRMALFLSFPCPKTADGSRWRHIPKQWDDQSFTDRLLVLKAQFLLRIPRLQQFFSLLVE